MICKANTYVSLVISHQKAISEAGTARSPTFFNFPTNKPRCIYLVATGALITFVCFRQVDAVKTNMICWFATKILVYH